MINSETVDSANQESNLRGSKTAATGTAAGLGDDDGGPWGVIGLAALAVGALAVVGGSAVAVRRREALRRGELAEAQIRELTGAAQRLGWPLSQRLALRELEHRFAAGGPALPRTTPPACASTGSPPPTSGRRARAPAGRCATASRLAAGFCGGCGRRSSIPPGGPRSSR